MLGAKSSQRVTSGVAQLDRILGGLIIGDNVVWYDDAGSLAWEFCLNLIIASHKENKPIIYVSFDRSPRNLLEKLGPMAEDPNLTIIDCFTYGKGSGSDIFLRFYYESRPDWPCRIIRIDEPKHVGQVMDVIYGVISDSTDDVRLVFESITGMQELWGGEDHILNFYTHSCPRLYELNTVAYWVLEKNAHSSKLRAQINQVAQVAIELSIKRGTTFLKVLKAEKRGTDNLHRPFNYWTKDSVITFEVEKRTSGKIELGQKLKELRVKRGVSQSEVAKQIGVTPSTISQIEGNLIYPSLPALVKMAEVLSVEVSSFFQTESAARKKQVFTASEAISYRIPDVPVESISARILTPLDVGQKAEAYLLEFFPNKKLMHHFFAHRGEELGYVLSGRVHVTLQNTVHKVKAGDVIYLTSEVPTQWINPGPGVARLLWLKIS